MLAADRQIKKQSSIKQKPNKKGGAMIQNIFILIFTAAASSFLWWRTRFKICRRCRSRLRRWAAVCHVCGAAQ
jgi:hypothetical protein